MAGRADERASGRWGESSSHRPVVLARGSTAALGLILLAGAALRLVVQAHAPALVVNRDSADFFLAGYQLATSGEFPLPVKRAPLYPLFLAGAVAALGPSLERIAALQHLLGLATVVLAYLLGTLAFGRAAGLLAALGAALNGSLLLMEQTIVSETIFVPLLLASLVALLVALRRPTLPPLRPAQGFGSSPAPPLPRSPAPTFWLALAGLLLGLAALTRPVAQAILPLMLLAIVVGRGGWRPRAIGVAAVCAGFILAVTPWIARNQAVHGVAAISSGLGDALFARTHRHDNGFEWRDHGRPPADVQRAEARRRVFALSREYEHEVEVRGALQAELGLGDVQGDAALREASLQVIRQQPLYWLQGSLRFFGELWLDFEKPLEVRWEFSTKPKFTRGWPEPIRPFLEGGPRPNDADRDLVERAVELYQDYRLAGPITLLFVVGAIRALTGGWASGAAILPLVVLSQLLLYVSLDGPLVRYRYAVQPLISLLAAGGLCWLAAALRARLDHRRLVRAGSAARPHAAGAPASALESRPG